MTRPGGGPMRLSSFVRASIAGHAAAAAAVATFPGAWPAILGAVIADHLALVAAGLWPRSRLLGPNLSRLPAPAARAGRVAITFDDGPDRDVTPEVLRILDAHRAKATFFCIGDRVAASRGLAAEIVARGHRIGNHTRSHPVSFWFHSPGALRAEVEGAQEIIEEATGTRPVHFRAPAGIRSPLLDPLLARSGLELVSWTRRAFDTVARDPEPCLGRLVRGLRGGDVLLLHDAGSARDRQGRPVVLEVLRRLLDELDRRSLTGVSLDARSVEASAGPPRE